MFIFIHSFFVSAYKGSKHTDCFFDPAAGAKFVSGNDMPLKSSTITNVPPMPRGDRCVRHSGIYWRKQENSMAEVFRNVATYCPPGGRMLDDSAGTAVCVMACLRLNMYVTVVDQDAECLEAGIGRAKRYVDVIDRMDMYKS